MKCAVSISGRLPAACGIARAALKDAAVFFAGCSSARCARAFRRVDVILQDDERSAEVHEAINGVSGATDVVTQPYDAMPGEADGVYGELYVNCQRAIAAAPRRRGWSVAKELLLYVAHGMDHLSGAEDIEPRDRAVMRRRELRWLKSFSLRDCSCSDMI